MFDTIYPNCGDVTNFIIHHVILFCKEHTFVHNTSVCQIMYDIFQSVIIVANHGKQRRGTKNDAFICIYLDNYCCGEILKLVDNRNINRNAISVVSIVAAPCHSSLWRTLHGKFYPFMTPLPPDLPCSRTLDFSGAVSSSNGL